MVPQPPMVHLRFTGNDTFSLIMGITLNRGFVDKTTVSSCGTESFVDLLLLDALQLTHRQKSDIVLFFMKQTMQIAFVNCYIRYPAYVGSCTLIVPVQVPSDNFITPNRLFEGLSAEMGSVYRNCRLNIYYIPTFCQ